MVAIEKTTIIIIIITKTQSKQPTSIKPHSSDAQNCETAAPSGHLSKAGSFDLSSYLFKQSELQLVHKEKVDSAKKSNATEDSKGKKGCAQSKVDKVASCFSVKSNKLYCLFLQGAIPLIEQANVTLQKEEPCIHSMHRTLTKQLREILVRFIKPELVYDVTKVDYTNKSTHKSDQGLFIGNAARDCINAMPDLDLYANVRNFYMTATKYMLKTFPCGDELLLHAKVVDPQAEDGERQNDTENLDVLEGQFLNNQLDDNDESKFDRIDLFWSQTVTER